MISIMEKINVKHSNKIAIMMCDNHQILERKSFEDILQDSRKFEDTFMTILNNNIYIGLLMEHNIYLPSIILCLQRLGHPFVHISRKELEEETDTVNVEYVLSHNVDIKCYELSTKIIFNEDNTFILWKNPKYCGAAYLFTNIFCVVHSSGTTGNSKTIRIPFNCIQNNALALGNRLEIKTDDVIFWGTPLSFDPSLIELLLALLNGASLVIVPYDVYINPASLFCALFNVANVTVVQMVPSVFLRWNDTLIEKILCQSKLQVLAFGGEVFPKHLLKFKRNEALKVFNLYGITELSCWATVQLVNEKMAEDLPIGTCLEDTIVEVRDETGEVLEEGHGEIFIGSHTRRCYVDNETDDSTPIYRETGDLAYIKDSQIYYRGRKNRIIKRYGRKVNLAKIEETVFDKCNLTSRCIWSEKSNKLLMFLLIKDNHTKYLKEKILDKIRSKLINILIDDCFPDHLEILQNFPTTSHGKIDERKLEEFYFMNVSTTNQDPMDLFCNLWCKYLGVDLKNSKRLENFSFFEMGGSSISVLQLISDFNELRSFECAELVETIFTKKFADCKSLIDKISGNVATKRKMGNDTHVAKQQKMEVMEMKILWRFDLKACVDGTPLVFTDREYTRIAAGSFCNLFTILDDHGQVIFKQVLTGSIESTPTVSPCKKYIYVGCYDGTMHCIDFNKPQIVWKFKTSDKIKSSAIVSSSGDNIMFGSYDKCIYCLSSKDGSMRWRTTVDGNISSNIVLDRTFGLFATTTRGTTYCISENSGEVNWTFNCHSPIFGTPCLVTKFEQIIVPTVSGNITCICIRNGKSVWNFQSDGYIFSSIVEFDDYIVFGCHDKHLYVLKIAVSDFKLIGKVQLISEISSTPFVYQESNFVGVVVATNIGSIYLINFNSLGILKQVTLPGEIFCSPVVCKNKVYVGCRDNNLYSLSLD